MKKKRCWGLKWDKKKEALLYCSKKKKLPNDRPVPTRCFESHHVAWYGTNTTKGANLDFHTDTTDWPVCLSAYQNPTFSFVSWSLGPKGLWFPALFLIIRLIQNFIFGISVHWKLGNSSEPFCFLTHWMQSWGDSNNEGSLWKNWITKLVGCCVTSIWIFKNWVSTLSSISYYVDHMINP